MEVYYTAVYADRILLYCCLLSLVYSNSILSILKTHTTASWSRKCVYRTQWTQNTLARSLAGITLNVVYVVSLFCPFVCILRSMNEGTKYLDLTQRTGNEKHMPLWCVYVCLLPKIYKENMMCRQFVSFKQFFKSYRYVWHEVRTNLPNCPE